MRDLVKSEVVQNYICIASCNFLLDPVTLAVLNKKVKVFYDIQNCTSQINYQAIVRLLNIGEQLVDLVSILCSHDESA